MRDWKQEVRDRLADLAVAPTRQALILDEVAEHLEDRHASLVARGTSDAEADRAVLQELDESDILKRDLGHVERMARSDPRPFVRGRWVWLETAWQDVRYAARTLSRTPSFTLVAAITLALGVGANAAIFSVVNTVMLRPLPFSEPGRLVRFWESNPAKGWPTFSVSHPTFLDWQAQNQSFERLAAHAGNGFTLTSGGDAEIVRASSVTAEFLPLLGIAPALGRNFRADEDRPGGQTQVAIVSHAFWQRRLNADRSIVGTKLVLDGRPYEVVGVLPESFKWGARPDILVPLAPDPKRSRGDHRLLVIGRLKPDVSLRQAQTEMNGIGERIARDFPESNGGWSIVLRDFYEWLIPEETRQSLVIMMGAVGLVLLIACGNVASLMLARGSARQKELSVRAALGAERSRLIRQLLVESMLLALVSAALGLAVAWGTVKVLVAAAPTTVPRLDELAIDATVFGFALALALLSALLFGLIPALQSSRLHLGENLKEGSRSATGGRARQRIRSGLVVVEVALSVALLIGAGLLVRSFWLVQQVNPGFRTGGLATFRMALPRSSYGNGMKARQFYDRVLPALAALPGVQSVATSSGVPMTAGNTGSEVTVPGKTMPPGVEASADWRLVSPGYFKALGVPLRGRDFTEADAVVDPATGEPQVRVTIISEEMARRYWPGEDAIGKSVILHSFGSKPQTIVGVAGDVRSFGLDEEFRPTVYCSAMTYPGWNPMSVVISSSIDPLSHMSAIRAAVRAIDPNIPIYDATSADELLSSSLGARRFNMYLLVCFAGVALLLSCVGLFGVLAYLVAQRTRDIGIRMALGANRRDVFRLIVGQGMLLAAAGAVAGIAGGYGAGRLIEGLLFAVEPTDTFTFVLVPVALLLVALIACYAPARRATRVDPLVALRAE
jgi:predicted permease